MSDEKTPEERALDRMDDMGWEPVTPPKRLSKAEALKAAFKAKVQKKRKPVE